MPEISVTLIEGSKHGANTDYRDNLPVNMYPVLKKVLGADGYMRAWPGLSTFGTGFGFDRGAVYNERQSQQYRVTGTKFASVAADGTVFELGDVPGVKQAAMPYSFNTQAIIANGRMYLYEPVAGFNDVTDADLGDPIDAVWVDGYYFLTDGEYIYHTDIADETSIDPLKYATAEFMPDPSLGLSKTSDNKVVVWGRYTVEYFVNAATDNFAFQRVETRAQKIGIVATHAKAEYMDSFFIVGGRKYETVGVHRVDIGRSIKISTREIDRVLAQYKEAQLSNIRVEILSDKATDFVLIHLPNETLCYCIHVGKWIYLKTGLTGAANYTAINGVLDPRAGKWVYGDKLTSKIGYLDESKFTQYTDGPQEWELYTPLLKLERASIDELSIETIPGFNDEGDAKAFLSMTYDGVVYGTEIQVTYGTPGDYNQRFTTRRLGYVSDWVGMKLRGATRSRMAFGLCTVTYG